MRIAKQRKHARGSISFFRERGTWVFYWYDEKGHRRSKTIGTKRQYPTKAAAWEAVEAARQQPAQAQPTTINTIDEVAARFETERMSKRFSHRRVSKSFLKCHILPRWGKTAVGDVQPREVELWLNDLKLASKTKSHLRSLLSTLVEFAMWAKMIPIGRNPMSLVRVRGVSRRARKPRVLTVEEFHSLIDQLKEPFRTIAIICVCLGLRISESLALQWQDIDWLKSTLSVQRSIVDRHIDTPKTAESEAAFSLTKDVLLILQLWRQQTQFSAETDWIFASPVKIGRLPYSYTGVWRKLKEAAEKAKLGWIGTHTFRHTYRAWMSSFGTDLEIQKRAMRHTDIRTTMSYGAASERKVDQVLGQVSGLVFANSTRNSTRDL
jgi:integrase